MKMTRLEWRYLQRIALDHPYFDTHKLPLTEKEAKAIVKANIKMTGREFVDSVYAKLGMTRPKEEKKCFAWLRNIGELFTVPPIRKIAIAVLVVVLMLVFFAATPTGRAIAESVIQYIVTLFEDGGIAVNQTTSTTSSYVVTYDGFSADDVKDLVENDAICVHIKAFEEFTKATGKVPYVLPLAYTELYYEYDEDIDYLVLYSTYDTQKGLIVAYQVWDIIDIVSTTSTEYEVYDSDKYIYYSVEDGGYIHCKRVLNDSVITVSSKGNYTKEDLIEMMRHE